MNQTAAAVLLMLTGTPLVTWALRREASGVRRRVRVVVRVEWVDDEGDE